MFQGTYPKNQPPMTLADFRRDLRRLRKLHPDINQWEYWYDAGRGEARWDGNTTVADVLKQLRGSDPDAAMVVEEHDGWWGPCWGFRYIPEERCVIIDYDCMHAPEDEDEAGAP